MKRLGVLSVENSCTLAGLHDCLFASTSPEVAEVRRLAFNGMVCRKGRETGDESYGR